MRALARPTVAVCSTFEDPFNIGVALNQVAKDVLEVPGAVWLESSIIQVASNVFARKPTAVGTKASQDFRLYSEIAVSLSSLSR
jgi:hypothetical protein